MTDPPPTTEFQLERYKYILQQLHTTNENVHRYLALYQTIATALAGGALFVFVSRANWNLSPATTRAAIIGFMTLLTLVGLFSALLVAIGILSWLDYRREEVELTDEAVHPGFRKPPNPKAYWRWHETYIIAFILASLVLMWILVLTLLLPAIKQ